MAAGMNAASALFKMESKHKQANLIDRADWREEGEYEKERQACRKKNSEGKRTGIQWVRVGKKEKCREMLS